jgi:Tol biopolymer transport system component/DNA-binding winged helix-turn-helix (wHTH) protein
MHSAPAWTFGPFEFDTSTFQLRRDGSVVPLEPKAVDVLRLLLERAPAVVEKSEIFGIVWKDVAVTDNALTRIVAQLRKALDDDARSPRYIETVATRGYRLVADVRTVTAGQTRRVMTAAAEAAPAVNADEAHAGRALPASRHPGVWIAALVIAVVIALAGFALRRAPAGEAAASASDPDIVRMATLSPKQLTTGPGFDAHAAFSPDGTAVAFSSDRTGAFEIYVQGLAAGSTPTALTSNGGQNIQPAWSPDGQFIAYHQAADDGVWVVPARGGSPRQLSDVGSRPAWSPDGKLVAFQTLAAVEINSVASPGSFSTIQVVDVATKEMRPITQLRTPAGPHVAPQWSRDGHRLFFAETPLPFAESGDAGKTTIWSIDVNTGDLRREAQSDTTIAEYAHAPDGGGAFMVARGANALWWQPFTAGGAPREARPTGLPILAVPTHPALSADARRLGWTAVTSATGLMSAALPDRLGQPQTPDTLIVGAGVRATGAVAAPDGRMAYSATLRGGNAHIWVRDRNGAARQVTLDTGEHLNPFWRPGFEEVAFYSVHKQVSSVNAVNVTTGHERVLFDVGEIPRPDGTALMAVPSLNVVPDPAMTRVAVSLLHDGVPNIWLAPLTAGRPNVRIAQLTFEKEGASFPHWSPDGKWLSFQCAEGADTHVCVVDTTRGQVRRLTHEHGQSFIGGWMDNDSMLIAARRRAIWNIERVFRHDGRAEAITMFADPRSYVRYPAWDAAHRRVVFERTEMQANVWTVDLGPASGPNPPTD